MRIGELGRRAGVSARTLRHYEELGLLAARRRSNGYREYDECDLRLVAEIRSLVGLGFALEETRPFVECLRAGHPTGSSCPDALAVQRHKLAEVDEWIARLQAVRGELAAGLRVASDLRASPPRCQFDHHSPGASAGRSDSPAEETQVVLGVARAVPPRRTFTPEQQEEPL